MDGVCTFVQTLRHYITHGIDKIGIIAHPAEHRVGASTPINDIGCAIPDQDVVECITGAVDRRCPSKRKMFNVRPKRVGNGCLDGVDTCIDSLDNHIC